MPVCYACTLPNIAHLTGTANNQTLKPQLKQCEAHSVPLRCSNGQGETDFSYLILEGTSPEQFPSHGEICVLDIGTWDAVLVKTVYSK